MTGLKARSVIVLQAALFPVSSELLSPQISGYSQLQAAGLIMLVHACHPFPLHLQHCLRFAGCPQEELGLNEPASAARSTVQSVCYPRLEPYVRAGHTAPIPLP